MRSDLIVMAHARALLTSDPAGRTVYVQADLHNPESILRHPSGSYLVASQTTTDFHDEAVAADGVQAVRRAGVPFQSRTSRSPGCSSSRLAWSRYWSGARRRNGA